MPLRTILRSDSQIFGQALILGGTNANTNWGDVGAGGLTLRANTADTTSPLLTVEARTGGEADTVMQIDGSVNIDGNLNVTGSTTTTTVYELIVNTDATVTSDLTVNGDSALGDDATADTTIIRGVLTVVTSPAQNLVFQGTTSVSLLFDTNDTDGTITWDDTTDRFNFDRDVRVDGDLTVTGSVLGSTSILPGLRQFATYNTEGTWVGSVLTLAKTGTTLGDPILASTIYLGPNGDWTSNQDLIPIMVYKNGIALRPGATQDYTVDDDAINDEVDITFNDTLVADDRIVVTFGQTAA